MSRSFHVHVHAPPRAARPVPTMTRVGDRDLPVLLDFSPQESFVSSFEETADRLQRLTGFFFEPDGSFAWNRTAAAPEHLEGVLYDRDGHVRYCELKGECSSETLRQFLAALTGTSIGDDPAATVVQLAAEGLYIEERVFLARFGGDDS